MKTLKSILILTTTLLFVLSCGDKTSESKTLSHNKSYSRFDVNINTKDTINRVDTDGNKQGEWLLYQRPFKSKPVLIESGKYIDNKKQGIWNYYDSTGKIIRIVKFKDDEPLN